MTITATTGVQRGRGRVSMRMTSADPHSQQGAAGLREENGGNQNREGGGEQRALARRFSLGETRRRRHAGKGPEHAAVHRIQAVESVGDHIFQPVGRQVMAAHQIINREADHGGQDANPDDSLQHPFQPRRAAGETPDAQ